MQTSFSDDCTNDPRHYRGAQERVAHALERYLPKVILDRVDVHERTVLLAIETIVLFGVVSFVELLAPNIIPFRLFEFWVIPKLSFEPIIQAWPLFAWGAGLTTIVSILTRNEARLNRDAEQFLSKGFALSLMAGVFEEIIFRWLLFFIAVPWVYVLNIVTFGIYSWLYTSVVGPIANLSTLGLLEHILFNGYGWAVGSAVIVSNGMFRNGHRYQGLLGFVNSWFIGMLLFLIMFQHGLLVAILIHFLYDMFIFLVRYVDAAIERALGWD
ncbi:MAG: hypothetical protein AAB388_01485 [Patescibacteria group bacterium]